MWIGAYRKLDSLYGALILLPSTSGNWTTEWEFFISEWDKTVDNLRPTVMPTPHKSNVGDVQSGSVACASAFWFGVDWSCSSCTKLCVFANLDLCRNRTLHFPVYTSAVFWTQFKEAFPVLLQSPADPVIFMSEFIVVQLWPDGFGQYRHATILMVW